MKQQIKQYFLIKWWIPVLAFVLASLLFVALIASENDFIEKLVNYLLLTTMFLLFVATVWQFIKGKWYWGIVQLSTLFLGIGFIFISSIYTRLGPDNDTFADQLKLPENVKLEYPQNMDSRTNFETFAKVDLSANNQGEIRFQLYNSFQPGLYEYDLWINSEKNGTVYLKAFEITKEKQLSAEFLKENSRVGILKTSGKLVKFGTQKHFTIHEGVWGKPYGARFEVWFQSENESEEIKLCENNYVIEGWMR